MLKTIEKEKKRAKKQRQNASYKKLSTGILSFFPLFFLMVLRDFFGSINGILFH